MDEQKKTMDIPTAQQFENEIKRIRYKKSYVRTLITTISSLLVVASIAVLVSMLVLPVLRVTGTSMTPTLYNDELLICNKRSNFECGDIIAFYFNNKILLKRVIGSEGDIIDISEDGIVYVNGEEIDEPYINEHALGECDIKLPYQVPDGRVFVMGDHRSVSVDSRSTSVGCVADEYIIGKVIMRIWPFEAFGGI